MDHILQYVFEFADFTTLKQARQVCHLWNEEATPKLLEKSRICVPLKVHQMQQPDPNLSLLSLEKKEDEEKWFEESDLISPLDNLISTYSFPLRPLQVHIANCSRALPFNKIIPGVLSHRTIIGLKYSGGNSIYPCCETSLARTENLSFILEQFPHLKTLETVVLNLQLEPPDDQIETISLWQEPLLRKLEELDEIHLNFWLNPSHLQNFTGLSWTNSIKSVRINHEQVFRMYKTLELYWPITKLELMLDSQVQAEVLQDFLNRVSPTLTSLKLAFFLRRRSMNNTNNNNNNNGAPFGVNRDIAHIPRTLHQLTHLELDITNDDDIELEPVRDLTLGQGDLLIWAGQMEYDLWRNVAEALQLPNLTHLTIRGKVTAYFDGQLYNWICTGGGKLKSDSVKHLILWPRPFSSPSILFSNMWPNLSSLTIGLDLSESATRVGIFGIFSELSASNLQKLELHLLLSSQTCRRSKLLNGDEEGRVPILNCDELITGLKCPENYVTRKILEAEQLARTNFKSIRNLETLKFLKLRSATCCQSHGLTDFSLYNGILFLKKLQGVEITRKFISERGLADLSLIFGSHVNIHFN